MLFGALDVNRRGELPAYADKAMWTTFSFLTDLSLEEAVECPCALPCPPMEEKKKGGGGAQKKAHFLQFLPQETV